MVEVVTTALPTGISLYQNLLMDYLQLKPTEYDVLKNITYTKNIIYEPFLIIYTRGYPDVITNAAIRYSLITIHVVLSIMTIIGNTLVLVVVSKRQSLRRNTAIWFILNLAICDLLQCIFYRPLLLVNLILPFTDPTQDFRSQVAVCRALTFLQSVFAGVGFHTIVAISQERLCLIVFPLKAKVYFASSRTKKALAIIWLVSIGCALPVPLMFAKLLVLDVGGAIMTYCGQFEYTNIGLVYFISMFFLYFGIPLMIIAASYTKIFNTLYRSHHRLNVHEHEEANKKQMKARKSLAKMMLAVAVIFALCWGPHFSFFLHASIGGKIPKNGFLCATIIEILPLLSSTMNPFIYTLNSRTFRIGLKSLFIPNNRLSRREDSMFRTFTGGSSLHGRMSVVSKAGSHRRLSGTSRASTYTTSPYNYDKVDTTAHNQHTRKQYNGTFGGNVSRVDHPNDRVYCRNSSKLSNPHDGSYSSLRSSRILESDENVDGKDRIIIDGYGKIKGDIMV